MYEENNGSGGWTFSEVGLWGITCSLSFSPNPKIRSWDEGGSEEEEERGDWGRAGLSVFFRH